MSKNSQEKTWEQISAERRAADQLSSQKWPPSLQELLASHLEKKK